MNPWIAVCLAIVIFCSPVINAALNDKNATSYDIQTYLKMWGSLMLSPEEEPDQKKLIVLDPKTIRFISPYAKDYKELAKNETGKAVFGAVSKLKTYLYWANGKEVWGEPQEAGANGRESGADLPAGYWIGAVRDGDNIWTFRVFDGKEVHQARPVNPELVDNLSDYFIPIQDASGCPLKIMAYHVARKDAGCTAGLIVQNNASQAIVNLQGALDLLDRKNKPVRLGNSLQVNRAVAIPALSAPVAIDFWTLAEPVDFQFIKPVITEIQYQDGTVWRNR